MSIFKKLLTNKKGSSKSIIKNSVIAGTIIFSGFGQDVIAKGKSYVAVEPLVCDLVKSIALPSDEVTCLVDRKQDVHDLKINPRQAQLLNSADKVFTLGKEMTPSMRNWENKKNTVVVGVSAIDVDDHSDHGGHDDHSDHGGHDDHAEGAFEWAGKFLLSKGSYKWSFEKVDGEYADPAMKMVILKSGDIEETEELAKELLESDDSIYKGDNDVLLASSKAISLNFDQGKESTVFNVEIKKSGKYTFFTEHMPFEFEADEHFFKDVSNNDVEPIAQVPDEGDGHHHHHHHGHGSLDPHVWHDPANIIKMSKVISKNLKNDISIFNRKDRKSINEKIDSTEFLLSGLNEWIVDQVSTIPEQDRVLVSKHKAMDYYGAAFGFETVSLLDFLGDSSSLRPENISSTLNMLKEENVKAFTEFLEKASNQDSSEEKVKLDSEQQKSKIDKSLFKRFLNNGFDGISTNPNYKMLALLIILLINLSLFFVIGYMGKAFLRNAGIMG